MSRIKRWTLRLGLLALGLMLALSGAEVFLRLFGKRPLPQNPVFPRWYFYATDYGYDITPNFWPPEKHEALEFSYPVWSNSLGCFDREPGGKTRVLLVGDSFTWGFAPFPEKWGTLLEKLTGVGVLKCGVTGYGSRQALLKARKILPQFPSVKLVVYLYCLNDLDDDYLFPNRTVMGGALVPRKIFKDLETGEIKEFRAQDLKKEWENYLRYGVPYEPAHPGIQRLKWWLNRHSALFVSAKFTLKVLVARVLGRKAKQMGLIGVPLRGSKIKIKNPQYPLAILRLGEYPWLEKAFRRHLQNVAAFKDLPARVVVPIIPLREQVYPELLKCATYRSVISFLDKDLEKLPEKEWLRPQERLKAFLRKEGLAYLDYLPLFRFYARHKPRCFLDPGRDLYWKLDGHWNVRGNHLAGLLLARFLVKEGLLPVQNPEETLVRIEARLKKEFGKLPPEDLWQKAIYVPPLSPER